MSKDFTITGFDVCVPGYERLRTQSEFILCAYPDYRSGWRFLRDAWLEDFACIGWDGDDYAKVRRAICKFTADLRRAWKGKRNPMGLEARHDGEEGRIAYLYITRPEIEDTWAAVPHPLAPDHTA